MKIKIIFLSSILCALPSILLAGNSYYVDCSRSSNGNGTYSSPWNNVGSVNSKSFSTGDDVYFKAGTTCSYSSGKLERLVVDWKGTSSDWVVIGAYHGEGKFGLGGGSRPVLDCGRGIPSTDYQGVIDVGKSSTTDMYLKISDLKVYDTASGNGRAGTNLNRVRHVEVNNCHFHKTFSNGLVLARSSNVKILNNRFEDNSENTAAYNTTNHASLEVTGMDGTEVNDILISGNIVSGGREGIGLYKRSNNVTVEKNVVYGQAKGSSGGFYIYGDAASNVKIRYNLLYSGTNIPTGNSGIQLTIESKRCEQYPDSYRNFDVNGEIYGNLIADTGGGIKVGTQGACYTNGARVRNMKIYNNTVVASENSLLTCGSNCDNGGGNLVKNNIFWTAGVGGLKAGTMSSPYWTFDKNMWNGNPGSPYNNGYVNAVPALSKTSGWTSVPGGAMTGAEFAIQNGSPAIKEALNISGYNSRINAADYSKPHNIYVNTQVYDVPDLGAMAFNSNNTSNTSSASVDSVPAPGNLKVITGN